jgi:hypothetical protein
MTAIVKILKVVYAGSELLEFGLNAYRIYLLDDESLLD